MSQGLDLLFFSMGEKVARWRIANYVVKPAAPRALSN
jgi:hypothetical protein